MFSANRPISARRLTIPSAAKAALGLINRKQGLANYLIHRVHRRRHILQ